MTAARTTHQTERSLAAIGRRLKRLRGTTGLAQGEFCRRAGISQSAYSQWETGRQKPGLDGATALVDAYRITLDYIYLGDESSLSYRLVAALQALDDVSASLDDPDTD